MNNAENVVVMDTVITNENNKKYVYHMVKRTFDIMVSLIACLFLLPLSIIVKVVSLLSGDTLFSVAKKYNIDIQILKRDNHMVDNSLMLGQVLRIRTNN